LCLGSERDLCYDKGICEEDSLGYFFFDRGCKVESVRLVIDSKRGDASRGFGFVDFEDQESFQKALDLNGKRAPDIAGKDGCLHIEAARPATEESRRKQQDLLQARRATEEMERELRFREARVTELMREVQRKRERQNVVDLSSQLADESKRQSAIQKAQESLRVAEETLHRAIEVEEERTKAMEAIACAVDGEQTRPHHEAAKADEADSSFHLPESERAAGEAPVDPQRENAEDVTSTSEQLQVRVRNTFLEYYVPTTLSGLVRTKTAPPEFLSSGQVSPKGDDDSPEGVSSTMHASSALTHATPGSEEEGPPAGRGSEAAKKSDETITGGAPRPRWSSIMDGDDSPCPTAAPWVLRREASAAEVSRAILEEKMGGPDVPRAPSTSNAAKIAGGATTEAPARGSGPPKEATAAAGQSRAAPERRHVRLRNVPGLPADELKTLLAEELTRLWRAVRGRPAPLIEEFRVTEKQSVGKTFAQIAAGPGVEVEIVFADADDAAWLVDGRQPAAWSRAETLSLRGRMLQVEWVAPAPVDWRRMRYTADTDASSHISYGTLGTRQSFSSKIGERADGARPFEPVRSTATGPARNRTIVLDGLPTNWPVHQVRDEVLGLLKKLWQRDGLKFDPREQLHQGSDGGVNVRHGRGRNEENGGTCLVRLRSYLDAKWLVESTGGRLTVGGGTQLRVSWARPRQGSH